MYNLLHYFRVKCLNGKVFSRYSLILCCFALKNIKNTILIVITIKLSKAMDGKSSCFFLNHADERIEIAMPRPCINYPTPSNDENRAILFLS